MNFQLKRLRKERGLRQEDLAKAIFSTPRIVGAWERGETPISLEDACTLADYFDITLDELAGREWRAPALTQDESELVDHYRATHDYFKPEVSDYAARQAERHPKNGDARDARGEVVA